MNLTTNLTDYRDQKFKELYKTYSYEGTTEITLDEKLITKIPSGFRPEESCQKLFKDIFEIAFHVGADRMLHIVENKNAEYDKLLLENRRLKDFIRNHDLKV